jgi:hypothetical protein
MMADVSSRGQIRIENSPGETDLQRSKGLEIYELADNV